MNRGELAAQMKAAAQAIASSDLVRLTTTWEVYVLGAMIEEGSYTGAAKNLAAKLAGGEVPELVPDEPERWAANPPDAVRRTFLRVARRLKVEVPKQVHRGRVPKVEPGRGRSWAERVLDIIWPWGGGR